MIEFKEKKENKLSHLRTIHYLLVLSHVAGGKSCSITDYRLFVRKEILKNNKTKENKYLL